MRFVVRIELAFALSLVACWPLNAASVHCSKPPGPFGTITCEGSQIPICEARGADFVGQCLSGGTSMAELLTRVLGKTLSEKDVQQEQYQKILRSGRVERPGNVVITFNVADSGAEAPPRSPLQPDQPEPETKLKKMTCTLCLFVSGEKICETGTGDTKEEARESAVQAVLRKLGPLVDSVLIRPELLDSIKCE